MSTKQSSRTVDQAAAAVNSGVVGHVDTINREMAVLIEGELLTFCVPVGCAVVLRGERVRLRMVQPRDRVTLTYVDHGELRMAQSIEVHG